MSNLRSAFISSIQRDFADVRSAARAAAEANGLRAVMAEQTTAPASPQRSLLGDVAEADALILILGPRYGDRGTSGLSPTEEEYRRALQLDKPVFVFVQDRQRDADQDAFVRDIGGTWEDGRRYVKFQGAADIGNAITTALHRYNTRPRLAEGYSAADERISILAQTAMQRSMPGAPLRLLAAPAVSSPLLQTRTVADSAAPDRIASFVRNHGLVSHAEGIDVQMRSIGISVDIGGSPGAGRRSLLTVGRFGEASCELVASSDDVLWSSNVVNPSVLGPSIDAALHVVSALWSFIDTRHEVERAALALLVPGAQMRSWGSTPAGNSISFPGAMGGFPTVLVAPEPPLHVEAASLPSGQVSVDLLAEIQVRFADIGAVH